MVENPFLCFYRRYNFAFHQIIAHHYPKCKKTAANLHFLTRLFSFQHIRHNIITRFSSNHLNFYLIIAHHILILAKPAQTWLIPASESLASTFLSLHGVVFHTSKSNSIKSNHFQMNYRANSNWQARKNEDYRKDNISGTAKTARLICN